MARLCKGVTETGEPCKAYALTGDEFCFTHNPAVIAMRAAAHSKGGKTRQAQVRYLKLLDKEAGSLETKKPIVLPRKAPIVLPRKTIPALSRKKPPRLARKEKPTIEGG